MLTDYAVILFYLLNYFKLFVKLLPCFKYELVTCSFFLFWVSGFLELVGCDLIVISPCQNYLSPTSSLFQHSCWVGFLCVPSCFLSTFSDTFIIFPNFFNLSQGLAQQYHFYAISSSSCGCLTHSLNPRYPWRHI